MASNTTTAQKEIDEFITQVQARLDTLAERIVSRVACRVGADTRTIAAVRTEVTKMKTELQNEIKGNEE